MAFPDAWLDELLAKNDIVSVISSYMELKPKGRRLWGLCPLHGGAEGAVAQRGNHGDRRLDHR